MNHEAAGDGLKDKWLELEQQINESCEGGSCSISTPQKATKKGFRTGTVGGITPVMRAKSWKQEDQEEIQDTEPKDTAETPETEYAEEENGLHTGEEKPGVNNYGYPEEEWTQKPIHEQEDLSMGDQDQNLANDLKSRYQDMQPESEMDMIQRIKAQYEAEGLPVRVMLDVGGTIKAIDEWALEANSAENAAPVVPAIPPTMGGGIEDESQIKPEDDIPFPELEPEDI
jgi:hypothetical protein